jgi:hypothetical protein
MGVMVATADARGATEKRHENKKRSFLDFFRMSRSKHKPKADGAATNGCLDTQQPHHGNSSPKNGKEAVPSPTYEEIPDSAVRETAPAASPTVKTSGADRNLTEDVLQQLFSGAPQFSATSVEGQLRPSVSFPWDFVLKTRDVSDSKPISHAAYSGVTLYQHLPFPDVTVVPQRNSMTYDLEITERPCMLAATGNEPGTVGLAFYLQEPEADILNLQVNEHKPEEVFENFSNFELLESQPEKLGIRKLDSTSVAERLAELSTIYEFAEENDRAFNILNRSSSGELYTALFGKVLIPPKYDSSTTDPTGLKVQIEALIRTLNLKRVWYDFSNVEWRIRVGQLLFTVNTPDTADSQLSNPEDGLSERDVVLLQLLLSCELYTRLEAVATLGTQEVKTELKLTADEVLDFRRLESCKTKWDLVLARRFLKNVDAKTYMRSKFVLQNQKTLARSLLGMPEWESTVKVDQLDIAFWPRRQDLQLKGLFHFAEALDWPDRTALEEHLLGALASDQGDAQGGTSPSIYATPLSTPGALTPRSYRSNRESGYFGVAGSASPEMTPRVFQLQPPSIFDLEASVAVHDGNSKPSIGGWLTRSYLTGLIMPGEAIYHLLISAMLENDAEAIAVLGDNANLYGGFVYKGRSFWSKSSILGRVLACSDKSRECMGWISSSILPVNFDVGWIDTHSTPVELSKIDPESFRRNTDILAGRELSSVESADLTLPRDHQPNNLRPSVQLEHLRLEQTNTLAGQASREEAVLLPSLQFAINRDELNPAIHDIALLHLVQFISAFPCTPPQLSAIKRDCTSNNQENTTIELTSAHPLHISYHYRQLYTTELLDPKLDMEEGESGPVTVIDARGGCALELLARAWCSSEGLDALIARSGSTCLGCAIREANGLGLRIMIRVGNVPGT